MTINSKKEFEHSVSKVLGMGKMREGWGEKSDREE